MSAHQWGIRMDGAGQGLEQLLIQHIATPCCPPNRAYTMVEVGSAGCVSLRAFRDIIAAARTTMPWSVIGTDLMPGNAWSMDLSEVQRSIGDVPHRVLHLGGGDAPIGLEWHNYITLCLSDDPRVWLTRELVNGLVDFVFIDGSHGKSCAYDFAAIEPKIAPGGLVAFHDYGEAEQGTDWQAFDREFISVRSYVHRLGLNAPCLTPRKGWRFVCEIKGSRHWNGDGNSVAVVQRTNEPLEHQSELSID